MSLIRKRIPKRFRIVSAGLWSDSSLKRLRQRLRIQGRIALVIAPLLATSLFTACHGDPARLPDRPALVSRPGDILRFDQADEGQELRFSVTLQNTSNRPVSILKTSSTCGCVIPKLDATTIPPGGSVPLPIEFHTEGQTGEAQKSIKVAYTQGDAQGTQLLPITILGTVKARLHMDPHLLSFDEVRLGQVYTRTILVASDTYAGFQLEGVDAGNDEITASWERRFKNGYAVTFTFRPKEERPCTPVSLRLANHAYHRFSLPTAWTYHSAVDAAPASIVAGARQNTFETRLLLTSREGAPLSDARVSLECENGELTLLESSDTTRTYSLRVQHGVNEAKTTAGRVRIDLPSDREAVPLQVPILIEWQGSPAPPNEHRPRTSFD